MKSNIPQCARCSVKVPDRICIQKNGVAPDFCPSETYADIIEKAVKETKSPENAEFAKQATIQEGSGYGDKQIGGDQVKPIKPRILETIEFAKRMHYQRLGLVFCTGLRKEASRVEKLFSRAGFEVVSAQCKIGCTDKNEINVSDNEKIDIGRFESMCNPIAQAYVMNASKTEFNVIMGLCVGHDSLFLKYAQAPCTVLAAKDRLLGHNPLAAVYTIDSYYKSLKSSP